MKDIHWADKIAEKLIKEHEKKKFVCAAGITPSGKVHIGNFRDVITSDLVCRALKDKGCQAELIFFWDDFDKLRKIPKGIPIEFEKYLGMPLTEIPDPYECHESYAKHFESEFEEVLPFLGIRPKIIYQAEMYKKNKYYKEIKKALQEREKIAKIFGKFKTQGISKEEKKRFFPLNVYCRKCRKSSTKIINYEDDNIEYICLCNYKETANIKKENIGKLSWKVDWAMRWYYYSVDFEPGGSDHATPGGSFDVAKEIVTKIFKAKPPLFIGYAFVGIKGATKMSSSKGIGIAPKELLNIYEPELLRWIFCKTLPQRPITFFFDSHIIKQYDEFDREIENLHRNKLSEIKKRQLEFSSIIHGKIPEERNANFRQVASFGQVVQGNLEELKKIFERLGQKYKEKYLKIRFEKSQNWIKNFMPELAIRVRETPNYSYYEKLKKEEKEQLKRFVDEMEKYWSLEKLTWFIYEIPKKSEMTEEEKKKAQRNFFKIIYNMLIDKDTGPRLPTLLMALGKEKVKKLLTIENQ
ncbi:MAG: lysine--tRNA ligase [Candidatus Pacearchaeota archaeon]|nr:lysine--tRNA ligase [Candidatus Pacearchaeota archaeon]